MTPEQSPLQISTGEWDDPDVRRAALRLLANASSSEYLPAAVDDTIKHKQSQLPGILQFLAVFGYEAARHIHGEDGAARFIGDELDTAEFGLQLDHIDAKCGHWQEESK